MLNLFQHLTFSTSTIKTLKQVQGDGSWNGRIEAPTDSATERTLHRPNNNEILRVLAGTNGFETRYSQRQILPKPVWKLLGNRHFSDSLNPPFNDSTRLSGGLSRDYDSYVAFV